MLPVLDLADADTDTAVFRLALREAAHTCGFFYLTGHGIPEEQSTEILQLARQFFGLPEAEKNQISQLKSPHFRGYSRLGGELTNGRVDWREQIDIGPERPVLPAAEGTGTCRARTCGPRGPQPSARRSKRGTDRCLRWACNCSGTGRRRWEPPKTCSTTHSPHRRRP